MSTSRWPYATTRTDRIMRNAMRNIQKEADENRRKRTAQWLKDNRLRAYSTIACML